MSSQASAISIDSVRRLSTTAKVNAAGLVLTSAGMLVQIAAGSTLYPSITGPIVLIVAAVFVAFGLIARVPELSLGWSWVAGLAAAMLGLLGATGLFLWRTTRFN